MQIHYCKRTDIPKTCVTSPLQHQFLSQVNNESTKFSNISIYFLQSIIQTTCVLNTNIHKFYDFFIFCTNLIQILVSQFTLFEIKIVPFLVEHHTIYDVMKWDSSVDCYILSLDCNGFCSVFCSNYFSFRKQGKERACEKKTYSEDPTDEMLVSKMISFGAGWCTAARFDGFVYSSWSYDGANRFWAWGCGSNRWLSDLKSFGLGLFHKKT